MLRAWLKGLGSKTEIILKRKNGRQKERKEESILGKGGKKKDGRKQEGPNKDRERKKETKKR
jgi:hypothetical protein